MTYHLRIYFFNLKCIITVIKLKLDIMRDKGSAKQKSVKLLTKSTLMFIIFFLQNLHSLDK